MWKEFVQEWMTAVFDAAGEVIQPEEQWIDSQGFTSATGVGQIPVITSGVHLLFETCKTKEGPWNIKSDNTPGATPGVSEQYAGACFLTNAPDATNLNRFDRYIRWRITASGAGSICFRNVMVFRA